MLGRAYCRVKTKRQDQSLKHGSMPKEMYVPDINTCKIFSCSIIAESSSMYD